jgi:hypothetical protein
MSFFKIASNPRSIKPSDGPSHEMNCCCRLFSAVPKLLEVRNYHSLYQRATLRSAFSIPNRS